MIIKEVLKVRKYKKYGYEVRTEIWEQDDNKIEMKAAYTPIGDYIGSPREANFLCKKMGIAPEKANPDHCVCSIGFNAEKQLWFGWSHRAIAGFGVGTQITKEDSGYLPADKEAYIEDLVHFYKTLYPMDNVEYKIEGNTMEIWHSSDPSWLTVSYGLDNIIYGRGEWTAESLEDAKQMAMDFAESVS